MSHVAGNTSQSELMHLFLYLYMLENMSIALSEYTKDCQLNLLTNWHQV